MCTLTTTHTDELVMTSHIDDITRGSCEVTSKILLPSNSQAYTVHIYCALYWPWGQFEKNKMKINNYMGSYLYIYISIYLSIIYMCVYIQLHLHLHTYWVRILMCRKYYFFPFTLKFHTFELTEFSEQINTKLYDKKTLLFFRPLFGEKGK